MKEKMLGVTLLSLSVGLILFIFWYGSVIVTLESQTAKQDARTAEMQEELLKRMKVELHNERN